MCRLVANGTLLKRHRICHKKCQAFLVNPLVELGLPGQGTVFTSFLPLKLTSLEPEKKRKKLNPLKRPMTKPPSEWLQMLCPVLEQKQFIRMHLRIY